MLGYNGPSGGQDGEESSDAGMGELVDSSDSSNEGSDYFSVIYKPSSYSEKIQEVSDEGVEVKWGIELIDKSSFSLNVEFSQPFLVS